MRTDSENEMERIQKNLEQFLMEDLSKDPAYKKKESLKGNRRKTEPDIDTWGISGADSRNKIRERQQAEPVREERKTGKTAKKSNRKKQGVKSESKQKTKQKTETKNKKGKKILVICLLIAAVLGAGWYGLVSAVYGKMTYIRSEELSGEPLKSKGVYHILLIGNDSRSQDEEGRSDAMILLSISSKTKTIQMISLLRDMYVEIPGHDGNRLNAAYAFGGAELLLETVRQNLGIEVNRYIVVNFQAFANLVDAAGGVDLELSNEEVQWVNAYLNEYNMLRNMPIDTDYLDTSLSGMIHLNGPQALAYSRNRYIGTDFGRTERQRKVLSAVIKKLPLAAVTNMKELIDGLFPNLTTNLTKGECLRLSLQAGKFAVYELVQSSVPVSGTYSNASIRGMTVLQVDFEANKKYLQEQIYGE